MTIRFVRSKNNFSLYKPATDTTEPKIILKNLSLFLKRIKLYPEAQQGINSGLEKASARYFITRTDQKSFTIPKNITSFSFDNVFNGRLPRRLIVGFLSSDSYNGNLKEDSFKFTNFGVNYIIASIDGVQYPSVSYTPDFDYNNYCQEFYNLYHYNNKAQGLGSLDISYENFKNGSAFFVFSFNSDNMLGAKSGVLNLMKRGSIRLEMKFKNALANPII